MKYRILKGTYVERLAPRGVRVCRVGDIVAMTEAQAVRFGLHNLAPVAEHGMPAPAPPSDRTAREVLDRVRNVPAAEAILIANDSGLIPEVTSKRAAIAALELLLTD